MQAVITYQGGLYVSDSGDHIVQRVCNNAIRIVEGGLYRAYSHGPEHANPFSFHRDHTGVRAFVFTEAAMGGAYILVDT